MDECGSTRRTDREALGRLVRETWIAWVQEQPEPKSSWLLPWEELAEPDREVDRRIGEAVRDYVLVTTSYVPQDVALDCLRRLEAAGYGKPGQPNTLYAMVFAACAEVERLREQTARVGGAVKASEK